MQENELLKLDDGRKLSYAVYGSPVPITTVFYFHAFPSSRLEGRFWHSAAAKLSIRLIAPDRPGMGDATFQPDRRLLDWPDDVIAIADHLRVQHFYIMGLSGGGPYTLACVKAVPKTRLAGAAVISGLYPVSLGTAGMLPSLRTLLWVSPWVPGLVGSVLDFYMGKAARNPDPAVFEGLLMKEIEGRPEADKRVLKDERNKATFVESTRLALWQGGQGPAWESRLYGSDWGFTLDELDKEVPLVMWQGDDDANCPTTIALKAKEMMPWARFHMKEGEGHVSYAFSHQEEVLGDLIRLRA